MRDTDCVLLLPRHENPSKRIAPSYSQASVRHVLSLVRGEMLILLWDDGAAAGRATCVGFLSDRLCPLSKTRQLSAPLRQIVPVGLARSRYRTGEKSAYRALRRTRYRKVERSRYRPVEEKTPYLIGSQQLTACNMVIERADNVSNICEMKFTDEPYAMREADERELRRKVEVFREESKTRHALLQTIVSVNGLRRNAHSQGVASVVDLDDLFAF